MDNFRRILLVVPLLLMVHSADAQRYISRNGHVWFYSHTPVEDIEAHNQQVAGILDISSGSIQLSLLIKSFEFKTALMQEHFNENYMESDKFPKADFKGVINNLDAIDFSKEGDYPAEVSGNITLHGVSRDITVTGSIEVSNKNIIAKGKFIIKPQDFDIEIPALVKDKIASEIETNIDITFIPN